MVCSVWALYVGALFVIFERSPCTNCLRDCAHLIPYWMRVFNLCFRMYLVFGIGCWFGVIAIEQQYGTKDSNWVYAKVRSLHFLHGRFIMYWVQSGRWWEGRNHGGQLIGSQTETVIEIDCGCNHVDRPSVFTISLCRGEGLWNDMSSVYIPSGRWESIWGRGWVECSALIYSNGLEWNGNDSVHVRPPSLHFMSTLSWCRICSLSVIAILFLCVFTNHNQRNVNIAAVRPPFLATKEAQNGLRTGWFCDWLFWRILCLLLPVGNDSGDQSSCSVIEQIQNVWILRKFPIDFAERETVWTYHKLSVLMQRTPCRHSECFLHFVGYSMPIPDA